MEFKKLLKKIFNWLDSHGSIQNHGHRKDKTVYTGCLECQLVNEIEQSIEEKENNMENETVQGICQKVVGLAVAVAQSLVKESNYKMMILRQDKEEFMGTTDYVTDRIKVEIDNGVVTSAIVG